jgi:hypothetical protein
VGSSSDVGSCDVRCVVRLAFLLPVSGSVALDPHYHLSPLYILFPNDIFSYQKMFVLIFSFMSLFAYWIAMAEYNENVGVNFIVFVFFQCLI